MNRTEPRDVLDALREDDTAALAGLHARLEGAAEREGLLDVAYRTLDTPLGSLLLAATPLGLVRVAYASEGHAAVLDALAESVSPRILRAPARLDGAAREVDEYFAGTRTSFDLPLDLRLAEGFRREVIEHLRDIAYGHRLRPQSSAGGRSLSSGVPQGRLDRSVRLRCRSQADPVKSGGSMTAIISE